MRLLFPLHLSLCFFLSLLYIKYTLQVLFHHTHGCPGICKKISMTRAGGFDPVPGMSFLDTFWLLSWRVS